MKKQMLLVFSVMMALLLTLSIATAQDDDSDEYTVGVQLVAQGLAAPVQLVPANDGTGRLFVVDQAGMIRIISSDGTLMPTPFLDLTGLIVPLMPGYDERGVLGLAFHPDYATNGRFFVYYTIPLRDGAPAGWDHTNVVAEFSVSKDDPNVGDLASAKYVLEIDQPEFNHDSGHITFGPDGYLYIPIGDGGGANDVGMGHNPDIGNGQDLTELHGSILRIDVNGDPGSYTVPADNPFVGQDNVAPEIYAYGFRNPYHISFDMGGDHDLYAADAGQDLYEEVDEVTSGGNYGWHIKEGTHCFDPNNSKTAPTSCASTDADGKPLIDPVIEYSHADVGVVVIGGYIYRGSALTDLAGDYIFGDYQSSSSQSPDGSLLWAEPSDSGLWKWGQLKIAGMANDRLGMNVLAIGQDTTGELYVLTSAGGGPAGDAGKVWKIVPADQGSTPEATSEAGGETTPAAGAATTTAPEPAATEQASG